MARIKYYYDTETCKYERVKTSFTDVFINFMAFFFVSLLIAFGLMFFISKIFPHPKKIEYTNSNRELLQNIEVLEEKLDKTEEFLITLENKDRKLYQAVTGADSIPTALEVENLLDETRYLEMMRNGYPIHQLMEEKIGEVKKLRKQIQTRRRGYVALTNRIAKEEIDLTKIPAIQPVENKGLKNLASGFGWRTHPIYKYRAKHLGVDFSCPEGTPVYATADGEVSLIKKTYGKYGKYIEIDHGHGYITRYCHFDDWTVKKGEKVKRGDIIGHVGGSTTLVPHLYYEVIYKDINRNPVHYFFLDLNEKEYEKIYDLATIENQSLS